MIGTQRRLEVADLLRRVTETGRPICAVDPIPASLPFEPLNVSRQSEHTRAVLKIQEGCGNRCSYCIIPSVRGPVRSRPAGDIRQEAQRLADNGFCEIVLTGIHLSSYGLDTDPPSSLLEPIRILSVIPGIRRIRLGSLEPTIATPSFAAALRQAGKVCPQFHLALQSGSDAVLGRMRRRYQVRHYMEAVDNLRAVFPDAALTTDILTGFPGETEAEFNETADLIRRVGFARIHVFPFSPRPGTPAASMPGQLTDAVKQERARLLIAAGECAARLYRESWIGRTAEVLPEEISGGCWEGYTPEYLRVRIDPDSSCASGVPVSVRLSRGASGILRGTVVP